MTRPWRWLVLTLVATPILAYYVHRLARGLGFLDPPFNREHELRRTILTALFAFILFLSIFLFGYANAWPRVWAIFGMINAIALVIFAGLGILAAVRLWRLRHPVAEGRVVEGMEPDPRPQESEEDAAGRRLL